MMARYKPKDREATYRMMLEKGIKITIAYNACYRSESYTHMRWLKYLTTEEINRYLEVPR